MYRRSLSLFVLISSILYLVSSDTCVLWNAQQYYTTPQSPNPSLEECHQYDSRTCCTALYSQTVANSSDAVGALILNTLDNVDASCKSALNKLSCIPCAPDQEKWLTQWPDSTDLLLCDTLCTSIFSQCVSAIVKASQKSVSEVYGSSASFCRNHFRSIYNVQLTSSNCYSGEESLRQCTMDDMIRHYGPCELSTQTRTLIYVPYASANCTGIFAPITGLPCDIACDEGEYLPWGGTQCLTCAPGTFSIGGGDRVSYWYHKLDENLPFTTGCTSTSPELVPQKCGWELQAPGMISSGTTPDLVNSNLDLVTEFVRNGHIIFEYRVESEPRFDGLTFSIDGVEKMSLQSDVIDFTRIQINVTFGIHTLRWSYRKDGNLQQGEDKAWIKMIELEGTDWAADGSCTQCHPGSYSDQTGADECTLCPANTYSNESGATHCTPCPANQYAIPGSTSCIERRPCTEDDYEYLFTPCVAPGKRSKQLHWLEPIVCDVASTNLPALIENLDCAPCNPGQYRTAGSVDCRYCPDGKWSPAGADSCTTCPAGTAARTSVHYNQFDDWSRLPGFSTSCSGDCGSPGWQLLSTAIDSGRDHGKFVTSSLRLAVEIVEEDAEVKFDFELQCETSCHLLFSIPGVFSHTYYGHDEEIETVPIPKGNHTLVWAFDKFDIIRVGGKDRAIIREIIVTGTKEGGAGLCTSCEDGTYSSSGDTACRKCPAGSGSSENATSCHSCPANTYSPVAGSACRPCGNGITTPPGSTQCTGICSYTTKAENQTVTYNLEPLKKKTMYGPVFDARGHKYFFSMCMKDAENHTCYGQDGKELDAYSCQIVNQGWAVSLGDDISFLDYEPDPRDGFEIYYSHGTSWTCPVGVSRSTSLYMRCNPDAGTGFPEFMDEPSPCHYRFQWRSIYGCPVCSAADLTYTYTKCSGGTMKKIYSWKESPLPKRCHGGISLPPAETIPCSEQTISCNPGSYLPIGATACKLCEPGSFSLGSGNRYDDWSVLEPFYTTCKEEEHVECTKWTPKGTFVESGLGTSSLLLSTRLIKAGEVKFTYKVHAPVDDMGLAFSVDGTQRALVTSSHNTDWKTQSYSLTAGNHLLEWTFIGGTAGTDEDRERGAQIKVIDITGTDNALSSCSLCLPGTYADSSGSTSCKPCAEDTVSHAGDDSCSPCDSDGFSLPNSWTCYPRPACTISDYRKAYTECNDLGQQTMYWVLVEPSICLSNGSYHPPGNTTLPCAPCPLGTYKDIQTGDCKVCPSGYYFDDTDSSPGCKLAPAGNAAPKRILYFAENGFNEFGPEWSSGCSGSCFTDGWRIRDQYLDSGVHDDEADSWVALQLELESAGWISFDYTVPQSSNQGNGLLFYVDDQLTPLKYHPVGMNSVGTRQPEGQTHSFTFSIRTPGIHRFLWNYHQEEGDVFGAGATLANILIEGPKNGGADTLLPCYPGFFSATDGSLVCSPCPAGSYSSIARATQCEKCPANQFAHQEGSRSCYACGDGTHSEAGASTCESEGSCTFFDFSRNYTYVLQEISGLVGPISNKSSGMDYYFSICSRMTDDICTDRSGQTVNTYVCARDKLYGDGEDSGSVLAFEPLNGDQGFNLKYSILDDTSICPSGQRRSTVIHFECDVHQIGKPELVSTACESLTFRWASKYACRECTEKDYARIQGSCEGGHRTIAYNLPADTPCNQVAPMAKYQEDCEDEGMQFPIWLIALFVLIFVGIAGVAGVMYWKYRRVSQDYSKLILNQESGGTNGTEMGELEGGEK